MIRTCLLLLFCFFCLEMPAQDTAAVKNISPRQKNRMIMEEKIRKLKNGVLLFRLQTRENTIKAMVNKGLTKQAEEIKKEQAEYNKEVIRVIKKYFDFCPVYFFYSNYSDYIISNKLDSVIFVNDSLLEDPTIRPVNKSFLTADFGRLQSDTTKYFSDYYEEDTNDGLEKRKKYYGSSEINFMAFSIMSDSFIQLRSPFPYYAKILSDIPLKDQFMKPVLKLNKKLWDYYRLVTGETK